MIYFLYPETKQKSLEEIDLLFGGRAANTISEDVMAAKERAIQMDHLEEGGRIHDTHEEQSGAATPAPPEHAV